MDLVEITVHTINGIHETTEKLSDYTPKNVVFRIQKWYSRNKEN